MLNTSTPSAFLEDSCEDLVHSHKLDLEAHKGVYNQLINEADNKQELKHALIQIQEAQEADKLPPNVIWELYEKALSSPHNGNKKLDDWMKQLLGIADEQGDIQT